MMSQKLQVINHSGVPLDYATPGSAGIDLPRGYSIQNDVGGVVIYDTCVSVAIPSGFVGLLIARSSLHRKGWKLANAVGVIDSDYRGSIKLALQPINPGSEEGIYDQDRVAQLLIVPCPPFEIEEVRELPPTKRGSGGFGSTGK